MNIITSSSSLGHLTEAIYHFNGAMDKIEDGTRYVDISRCLSDCLNKLQMEWVHHNSEFEGREIAAFRGMIYDVIGSDINKYSKLLDSTELINLSKFHPLILNHSILKKGGYRPGLSIDSSLEREATKEHYKLNNRLNEFLSNSFEDKTKELVKQVLNQMAQIVYIVRSNIAHGEKTPFGPDLDKRQRDESVCKVIIPLQLFLIDLLLDQPSNKLVVYGTLAPGQPNAEILTDIIGTWKNCIVRGKITESYGLKMLHWNPIGENIETKIFQSNNLPNNWLSLNQFEGSQYVRRLVLAHPFSEKNIDNSPSIEVAYAYIASGMK